VLVGDGLRVEPEQGTVADEEGAQLRSVTVELIAVPVIALAPWIMNLDV
jgi:hypothetical protein